MLDRSRFRLLLAGLAFTTFATLLLELTLTRVFSVILWYHFAFMSVSLSLFGLSAGGILLFLFPQLSEVEDIGARLAKLGAGFGVSTALLLVTLLNIHWVPEITPAGMSQLAFLYLVSSVPFFLSGLSTAMVLKRFARQVNALYFVDLFGAAMGCVVLIPLLDVVGGLNTVFLIAAVAALSGVSYSLLSERRGGMLASVLATALCLAMIPLNGVLGFAEMRYIKGWNVASIFPEKAIFDGWNSFSRVAVYPWNSNYGDFNFTRFKRENPFAASFRMYTTWGKSDRFTGVYPKQLNMHIDGAAGTMITQWDGQDRAPLAHIDYEITSLGYILKKGQSPEVLIIGPGGGPDVLAAVYYESKRVVAVELNPLIKHIMTEVVGEYAGNLYSRPEVEFHVDEGRSFIRRSPQKFDIIQASLIDTWAATSAGAYTLSENTLYTIEAFHDYLEHLKPGGIVSMARYVDTPPRQTLRVVSLAVAALQQRGVTDPSGHFLLVKVGNVANMLLGREPFSDEQVQSMVSLSESLGYEILYAPGYPKEPYYSRMIMGPDREGFINEYPFDISPSTDDRPFFFNMVKPKDWLRVVDFNRWAAGDTDKQGQSFNYDAVYILFTLLGWASFLVGVFIILPLFIRRTKEPMGPVLALKLSAYFASLGLGFMVVEMSLLHKFILFLGHPVYALAVILFSILVSSSFGASFAGRFTDPNLHKQAAMAIGAICVLSVGYGLAFPYIFAALIALPTSTKVVLSVVMLLPLGFCMGMPFPSGLRILNSYGNKLIPWAWGVNGATSVLGSIIAFASAMIIGYTSTLYVGVAIYLFGLVVVLFFPHLGGGEE